MSISDSFRRLTWPGQFNGYAGRRDLTQRMADDAVAIGRETGIPMILTQGSWSGGSLSGGTHSGSGASDWAVWGRVTALRLSAAWRARGYVAWARGIDADGDGRKDDSFDPHVHVLDPTDQNLSWSARNQVGLFNQGLDGLVGGRPDREPTKYIKQALEAVEVLIKMDINDKLPGGDGITIGQALLRGAYAYEQVIDSGGAIAKRLKLVQGRVAGNTDARAQAAYEAVFDAKDGEGLITDVKRLTARVDRLEKKVN